MNHLITRYLAVYWGRLRRRGTLGFTLIELLVAGLVAAILTGAMLSMVVELMQNDRRDFARTEVQREMAQALDFIASDLRQAIYIYEPGCVNATASATNCPSRSIVVGATTNYLASLASTINLPSSGAAKVIPVVAFWKLDKVPYVDSPTGDENLPTTAQCTAFAPNPATATTAQNLQRSECEALRIVQNAYTLVVYALVPDNSTTDPSRLWEGPAFLRRYQLQQYPSGGVATLTKNYTTDPDSSFRKWPCSESGGTITCESLAMESPITVVDYVDYDIATAPVTCATSYTLSGQQFADASALINSNFYACVRSPVEDRNIGLVQDAILYLRGNALTRANFSQASTAQQPLYKPSVQTQAQARSVFQRTPPN
ncbi:hypothetical protein DO97_04460 [Neosynechococcus sphagnicola sy1]|uniref:Prepilin-type N-terminal cleavage/methylation domain-containing protein n=1 Tax=Neosynechococcus sphagnicola sy1 TaxID=1497020 RepID=A0A098TKX6_9CYAN|nr:hypothetical protein [Neosynechococcus sphagnicola]KGF72944.1 hypothetical protein DO97_04460 [Neosynechococcus sphagnicola sy1]